MMGFPAGCTVNTQGVVTGGLAGVFGVQCTPAGYIPSLSCMCMRCSVALLIWDELAEIALYTIIFTDVVTFPQVLGIVSMCI